MPKSKKRIPSGEKTAVKKKKIIRTVVRGKTSGQRYKQLLDKRKASPATKLVALVIAVSFIIWLVIGSVTSLKGCAETPVSPVDAKHQAKIDQLKTRSSKESTSIALMSDFGNEYFDWGVELQQNAQANKSEEMFKRSQEMFGQSLNYYQKVLTVNPTNTAVRTDMSSAYYYTGQIDKSLEELKVVVQMDPNLTPAWFNLGLRYYEKQNFPEAIKAWEQFLALEPQGQYADQIKAKIAEMQKTLQQSTTQTVK